MEEHFEAEKKELTSLSIKDLFYKYVRFLPLFVISVALALLGAFLYLRYSTPIYRSTGSLIIKVDNRNAGSGDKFEQLVTQGGTINIQNEIEQLKSRPLMERVVNKLGLNFSYFTKGKINETDIYKAAPFVLEAFELTDSSSSFNILIDFANAYGFRINGEKTLFSFGQVFKNSNGVFRLVRKPYGVIGNQIQYRVNWQSTPAIVSALSSNLLVVPKGNTNILILTLEATNPLLAADVINQLMKEYGMSSVEEKRETTKQTIAFINDRLKVVTSELDSITSQLLSYQQANNLIDFESQSGSYFSRVEESDKLLAEQRAQLEIITMIEGYLRNSRNDFSTTPSALGISDPTLSSLIAAYNVAQLERKAILDKNVPRENPVIQEREGQIEKLRQSILENLRNIRSSYSASINDLERRNSAVQAQIRALPVKQQNLIEIQRQQQTKQAVYNILMEKREESAITSAATISNIRIIEEGIPNFFPVKPNRQNVQLMAVFIGLVLPALFIFVLEVLNDKVTTRYDIERITAATILGEVGHSYSKQNLVVKTNSRGIIAEQFRVIRSNLQYVIHNSKSPVILITSSFSGEGKSFISTNIGAVMALANKKTIILEFDIRKPKVLSHLNLPKKPGLTNYLLGKVGLEELPVPVPDQENLYVLPCGPVPPNPAELLLDPKFADLFDYLRKNFEVIVMDTAPVGMVSDAMTLSKFADATLYIVRQGHTYKKQIGLIDEFYQQGKLPKISIVLNDIKLRSGYGYYGYGRYSYGYGTGYFDDLETPPPTLLEQWFGWLDLSKWKKSKKAKAKA